ncbi:MAG: rcp1 [Pedosphaera sp.]|nr:rcp1 [Pedosphaera sp.]
MLHPAEILVVEDYEPDAHLLQLLLKRNLVANKLHVVADGREALDYVFCRGDYSARGSERLPGVIILDIRLPKMDGWEVLRQLRLDPLTNNLPVIMVSGLLLDKEVETAARLGANACIAKPIQIGALRAKLNQCGFAWMISESESV